MASRSITSITADEVEVVDDPKLHAYRTEKYTASAVDRFIQRLADGHVEIASLGLDVSHFQEEVNWDVAVQEFITFAAIRALYGLVPDTKFSEHWQGSRGKVPRSAYVYYKDDKSPEEMAEKLFERCEAEGDLGELPPTIDVEELYNPTLTASRIKRCTDRLTQLWGLRPTIYTAFYVWRDVVEGDKTWAADCPLHIARYPLVGWEDDYPERVLDFPPQIPFPWTKFDVWQWTSSAPAGEFGVSGHRLDLNYCSPEFYERYVAMSTIQEQIDELRAQVGEIVTALGTINAALSVVNKTLFVIDQTHVVNTAWPKISPTKETGGQEWLSVPLGHPVQAVGAPVNGYQKIRVVSSGGSVGTGKEIGYIKASQLKLQPGPPTEPPKE